MADKQQYSISTKKVQLLWILALFEINLCVKECGAMGYMPQDAMQ